MIYHARIDLQPVNPHRATVRRKEGLVGGTSLLVPRENPDYLLLQNGVAIAGVKPVDAGAAFFILKRPQFLV